MRSTFSISLSAILCAWLLLVPALMFAATLSDFGYQQMKYANGRLILGTRPLLIIRGVFQGGGTYFNSAAYYDEVVFNQSGSSTQHVVGYFLENSINRFTWTRAGIITLAFTAAERLPPNNTSQQDFLYHSNIIYRAMTSGLFPFRNYDSNGDNVVTDDELEIMIASNDTALGHRNFGCVRPAGFSYSICGNITHVNYTSEFATICHELGHGLGEVLDQRAPTDIYGANACLSSGVSLMSCTGGGNTTNLPFTFHFDPWHKMQLGWNEPRLVSLKEGGLFQLPAVQFQNPAAPLLLYDPDHGFAEFFMLEYRTTNTSIGPGYDREVNTTGLALWYIQQDGSHRAACVPSLTSPGNCDRAVFILGSDFQRGSVPLWPSESTTPYLSWLDGTATATRIHVQPFSPGSDSITVEVITEGDTWVDFNYAGTERGTFSQPYNTLAEGVAFASWGGTVKLKAGSRNETALVNKRVTLEASGGTVIIGQ